MAREDGGKMRIALRGEDRDRMSHRPESDAGDPELEPDAESGSDCAVDDRHRTRSAAEQDRLGERPMQRDFEAFDRPVGHDTSAPPPNEKNERKKLEAAKAIEMPKTI